MNKLGCLIGMFIYFGVCRGQNLIPNPSFELHDYCIATAGTLDSDFVGHAIPWHRATRSTPDYFQSCATYWAWEVPANYAGFQPAKTGNSYVGICIKYSSVLDTNWREYIYAPLLSPLSAGVSYYAEMFVCVGNISGIYSDRVGMYFSNGPPDTTGVYYGSISQIPQIDNPTGNIISDTLNWIKISGCFTAVGGENYVTIGNFRNNASTAGSLPGLSYLYIDDVFLSDSSCTTQAIENKLIKESIQVFPNLFNSELNVIINNDNSCEFILYDLQADKLLRKTFSRKIIINTEQLSRGIYIYEVRNNKGVIKKGKVVKE